MVGGDAGPGRGNLFLGPALLYGVHGAVSGPLRHHRVCEKDEGERKRVLVVRPRREGACMKEHGDRYMRWGWHGFEGRNTLPIHSDSNGNGLQYLKLSG